MDYENAVVSAVSGKGVTKEKSNDIISKFRYAIMVTEAIQAYEGTKVKLLQIDKSENERKESDLLYRNNLIELTQVLGLSN